MGQHISFCRSDPNKSSEEHKNDSNSTISNAGPIKAIDTDVKPGQILNDHFYDCQSLQFSTNSADCNFYSPMGGSIASFSSLRSAQSFYTVKL